LKDGRIIAGAGGNHLRPAAGTAIRAFHEADRAALAALFLEARRVAFDWLDPAGFALADFDVQTEGERILVATQGGVLVGFAAIWEADNFLHHLYVHPRYLHQGLGRALLQACQAVFTDRGRLKCLSANESALRFYLAEGWQIVGEDIGSDGPYLLLECQIGG